MTSPLITVRGEAQVDVPPDRATLSATVHSTGSTAAVVRRELAEASEQVRAVVAAAAQAATFSTTGLHVGPVLSGRSGSRVTGYRGSFTSTVEVSDLVSLSELLAGLASLPQAQVDGPWWSLRRDHPAFRQARPAAVDDARRRADDYAAAFGAGVGAVVEVSDLDGGPVGRPATGALRAMAAADEAAFDLEPTVQTVTGQVTVRFTMTA